MGLRNELKLQWIGLRLKIPRTLAGGVVVTFGRIAVVLSGVE